MITKCGNGHWYDSKLYDSCPHCKQASEKLSIRLDDVVEDDHTVSFSDIAGSLGDQLGSVISSATGASTVDAVQGMISAQEQEPNPAGAPISGGAVIPPAYVGMNGMPVNGNPFAYGVSQGPIPGAIPMGMQAEVREDDTTVGFGIASLIKTVSPVVGWLVCTEGSEKGQDYRLHAGKNFIGRSTSMDVVIAGDREIAREKHATIIYDPRGNHFFLVPEVDCETKHNDTAIEEPTALADGDRIDLGETTLIFVAFCKEGRVWKEK